MFDFTNTRECTGLLRACNNDGLACPHVAHRKPCRPLVSPRVVLVSVGFVISVSVDVTLLIISFSICIDNDVI